MDAHQEFQWVRNHPWMSWRNRYVKNKEKFDDMIEQYMYEHGKSNDKASYPYDARLQKKYQMLAEEEEESEEDEEEIQQQNNPVVPQNQEVHEVPQRTISEELPADPRPQKRTSENSRVAAEKRRRADAGTTVSLPNRTPQKGKNKENQAVTPQQGNEP
jgi:hypothetical protein